MSSYINYAFSDTLFHFLHSAMFSSLVFLFFVLSAPGSLLAVQVNTSSQLEKYLCINSFEVPLFIELTHTQYNITQSCKIVSNRNISITSKVVSAINCHPSAEMSFFASDTFVTLKNLEFNNCGAHIKADILPNHKSFLTYNSDVSALFVLIHCQLIANNVKLWQYIGYALIGINMWDSQLTTMNVTCGGYKQQTSGIIIHYKNITNFNSKSGKKYKVLLENITVYNNYNTLPYNESRNQCFYRDYKNMNKGQIIVTAAGITILYTETQYEAQVTISNCEFYRNNGIYGGALLVLHYIPYLPKMHGKHSSSTNITNTSFKRNSNSVLCNGAAIAFYWIVRQPPLSVVQPLLINNCSFVRQEPLIEDDNLQDSIFTSGNMYLGLLPHQDTNITINIKYSNFTNNVGDYSSNKNGACITAENYDLHFNKNINITLDTINATRNQQNGVKQIHDHPSSGIFSFFNIPHVYFCGISNFSHNNGSVIFAVNSNIHLSGNMLFFSNYAIYGPSIWLRGQFQLHFNKILHAVFQGNQAEMLGGALYLDKDTTPSDNYCAIESPMNKSEVNISFIDNKAKYGGNSIYAYPIFSCDNNGHYIKNYSHFCFNNRPFNRNCHISSKPYKLLKKSENCVVHPGASCKFHFAAVMNNECNVWGNLDIAIHVTNCTKANDKDCGKFKDKVQLQNENVQYRLIEGSNVWTPINFTVLVKEFFKTPIESKASFSAFGGTYTNYTGVYILPCPLGFQLQQKTGICKCGASLKKISSYYQAHCDITHMQLSRPNWNIPWVGITGEQRTFGASHTCPLEYCTIEKNYTVFHVSENDTFELLNPDEPSKTQRLCRYNRSGTLCGKCPNGTGVILGASECRHCPPAYVVLTVVLFLLAGPLFIMLLYSLQLTLMTGTLNGIIFFAQAANVGLIDMLRIFVDKKSTWIIGKMCTISLSLLNLNLGFPLCFYNGMKQVSKDGLSLLFPIYLLSILVVLIVLSHFSQKLSNRIAHSSIQVLVTVVHLSFSNLLGRTIKVFSPATIFYDVNETCKHKQVWYYDGEQSYNDSSHLALMTVTLIVSMIFVLPYIIILICARSLRRSALASKYLRPIIEAIHAPYKEGKEYWFVTRLIALILIYIIYMCYITVSIPKIYVTVLPIIASLLVLQAYLKPFKKKVINILDCWIMFLLLMVGIISWYYLEDNNYLGSSVICEITVFLFMCTFLCVVVYHVFWVTGVISYIQFMKRQIQARREERRRNHFSAASEAERNELTHDSDAFYGSNSYRESLLSSAASDP